MAGIDGAKLWRWGTESWLVFLLAVGWLHTTIVAQELTQPVPNTLLEDGVEEPTVDQLAALDQAVDAIWQLALTTDDPALSESLIHVGLIVERSIAAGRIRCVPELVNGRKKRPEADGYANPEFWVTYPGSATPDVGRYSRDPDNQLEIRECLKIRNSAYAGVQLVSTLVHEAVHMTQECDVPFATPSMTPAEKELAAKKRARMEVPAYCLQHKVLCELAQGGHLFDIINEAWVIDPFFDPPFLAARVEALKTAAEKQKAENKEIACL